MGDNKLAWVLRKEFWWPGKVLDEGNIYCVVKYIGLDTKKGFEKDDVVWNPDKERRIKLVQETVSLIKASGSLGTILLEAYREAVIQNEKLIDENADLSSLRVALAGKNLDLDLEEEVEEEEAVSDGIFQVQRPTSVSLEKIKNESGETEGLQPGKAALATPAPQVLSAPRPRSDSIAARLQALVSSSRGKGQGACGDLKELNRKGGIIKSTKAYVPCPICGKLLFNNLTLNRHIQAVHEKNRVPCVLCDYSDCDCTDKLRLLSHQNP